MARSGAAGARAPHFQPAQQSPAAALLLLLLCAAGSPRSAAAMATCPVTPAQMLRFIPDAAALQRACHNSPGGALACNEPCFCVFGTTLKAAVAAAGKTLAAADKDVMQARTRGIAAHASRA
jgi:hypothetical protein